jgi:glucose-6-phosphate dehydrogenase assembly protein OpcA
MTPGAQTIKPDRILHELSQLWVSLSKQEEAHQPDAGVIRACSMTLIAFVDEEADAQAMGELFVRLMKAHPSRTIVVRLREDSGVLESRVFATCWTPFGHHREICCEQVEFSVSIDRARDIPSVVFPLVAPDVPRVLWFRSSRIESVPDLGDILALGDKMIVDSARPGAPAFADLRVLAKAGMVIGDLAWTRLTRLRQLIAQLLAERELDKITQVSIELSGSDIPAEAKYLQAWLRTELRSADVLIRRMDPNECSEISGIRIGTDIHIRVESDCAEYESGSLRQRANLSAGTSSTSPHGPEADLLSEEVSIMTHDRVFERVLQRMTVWNPRS